MGRYARTEKDFEAKRMQDALNIKFTMPAWAEIPDLGLYMDQVITFTQRSYAPLYGDDAAKLLTSSMVNNYVKAGLIARPLGKKYGREQLAAILMIVQLKGVLSMDMIRLLVTGDIEACYKHFCERQSQALCAFAISDPMQAAVESAINALVCQNYLELEK